jgi:aspartate carbamoyltransferase catalytic subunit
MSAGYKFTHKHLIDIKTLSREDIEYILDISEKYVEKNRSDNKSTDLLKGKELINLFFENSTRTRTSFELAGKRLGAHVLNMDVATSSINKGETLLDTALTLNAMHPDFIVIRHKDDSAAVLMTEKVSCSVINAGTGTSSHPTQALLDAFTIKRKLGGFAGRTVTISGDIKHSRVARSNIDLLTKLGVRIKVAAPKSLLPEDMSGKNIEVFDNLEDAISGSDIIMLLRLQKERMEKVYVKDEKEYFERFGLNRKKA